MPRRAVESRRRLCVRLRRATLPPAIFATASRLKRLEREQAARPYDLPVVCWPEPRGGETDRHTRHTRSLLLLLIWINEDAFECVQQEAKAQLSGYRNALPASRATAE